MFENEDLVQEALRLWYKLEIGDHHRMVIATNFHNERVMALLGLTASAVGYGVVVHQSTDKKHQMTYFPIWGRFSWRFRKPAISQIMNQVVSGKTPRSLPKNALEEAAKLIAKSDEIVFTAFV